ncbi:MAG: hypothetical protein R3B47_09100 [Bacteroidia bacterium]
MPGMTGVEFLSKLVPLYPDTMRIVVTGYSDIEAVIDAIGSGDRFFAMNSNPGTTVSWTA